MDLFQGLEQPVTLQHSKHLPIHQQPVRCWNGTHILVAAGEDTPCVVQLSVKANLPGHLSDTIPVTANVHHLEQPGELLCVGQCRGTVQCSVTSSHQPAALDLVALFKDGCKLRLCSVGHQAAAGQLHLIAEFEHEGFAQLEACDCHVLPGPIVLLQPEQGQLLVLLRATQAAAPSSVAVQGHDRENADASSLAEPAWQLVELDLPADVLQAAVAQCPSVQPQLLAHGVHSSSGTKAAGQWQLLHASSPQQGLLQLLLAVPVAGQGVQQDAALLCLLHVRFWQHAEAAGSSGSNGMKVIACQLLPWPALPSCAAVWGSASHPVATASCSSPQQFTAIGSQAGDVLVVDLQDSSSSIAGVRCLQPHQQMQTHSEGGVIAAGQLSGAVEAITHLPQVYACGACHADVLAVLHTRHAGTVSSSSGRQGRGSSMDVSLLRLQAGGQLQELTVIQGALGLCASVHSPLGLLCPTERQQLQCSSAVADQSALQLAAVVVLSSSSGSKQTAAQGEAAAAGGLGAHAWLDSSQATGLPGPLLGILATAPDASIPHNRSAASAAGAVNNGTDAGGLGVQDSAELQGLQSMLAVLEGRWQQDTRELSGWQQRFVTAQRLAAAGHRHLCQMAADTLYRSTVRQFVLPVGLSAPGTAQAMYEAGRQLGAQQQEAPAALPPSAGPVQPDVRLLLQAVSIDSSLQDNQLQLQVCCEPSLHCVLPHDQVASMPAWRGALLQPCHAELLLWHAGTAGVKVRSSWAWDAVAGKLIITAATGLDTLLQLHSIHSTVLGQAQAGVALASRNHCVDGSMPSVGDGQQVVAQALAAAARRLTGGMPGCSCNGGMGSSCRSGTLQLQAAVAVSACCSTQAVVQWESSCQQQQLTAGQRLLQRTQLMSPAVALLHLQPVQVSVQDILLQQVAAQTRGLMSAQPPAAADLQAAVAAKAAAIMHAGSKDTMQTPVKASAADQVLGDSAGLPDVVPPTPCSVIPDSQEDEEQHSHGPHERRQQLQQWWQSQRQPPALSAQHQAEHGDAEVCSPGEGDDSRQGAASAVQAPAASAGQHVKLLLVQSSGANLQLLPRVLQRMQCFHAVHSRAAGSSSPCQHFVLKAADQRLIGLEQQLGAASSGSSGDAVLSLVPVDAYSMLVKVAAPALQLISSLHQLLSLGLHQLREAASVGAVQVSCLDEAHQGSLAAATQFLAGATHLHIQVLEDMLHQANDGAAAAKQQQMEGVPLGMAATVAGSAEDAAAASQEIWAACLLLQADVDLAVAQLCKMRM